MLVECTVYQHFLAHKNSRYNDISNVRMYYHLTLVPEFLGLPNETNHEPPLLQIVGATATVSTLATVVGQPKTPTSAGKGGFRRGLPCLPSIDSIRAYNEI